MLPALERDPRYQSLDVWRGLACLMVVLDHAAMATVQWSDTQGAGSFLEYGLRCAVVWGTRQSLGPPLFFVISGYCIAASVDSLRRKGKSAFDFMYRRLWRTFPPYWTAVLVYAAVVLFLDAAGLEKLHRSSVGFELDSPTQLNAWQWFGNLTLTETWRSCFLGGGEPAIFTRVAWSLCYQEQFYAVCFVVALLTPRRLYGVLAAATAAILAVRVMAWDSGMLFRMDGLFPVYWHEFAVGLAVYWRLNVAAPRAWKRGVDLGLIALVSVGMLTEFESTAWAAAFGLVLVGARRWDGRLAGVEKLAPVRACGKRCYSIYLIHLPACTAILAGLNELGVTGFWPRVLISVPLASAGALVSGWLFYEHVESRFLNLPVVKPIRVPREVETVAVASSVASVVNPSRVEARAVVVPVPVPVMATAA